MMSGSRSRSCSRPILGRKSDMKDRESSKVSDLFPDPCDAPVWNSAILFPESPTLSCDAESTRSFNQDVPLYGPWSVGDSKWCCPDIDPATRTTACQTEWSFPPQELFKEPLLPKVSNMESLESQMEHLALANPDDSFAYSKNISWQQRSPSASPSPPKQESPTSRCQTQERCPVQTERRHCVFCKQNGETKEYYLTHVLKDSKGNVVCPTLRDYVCPICGATGTTAHTISYCPYNKEKKKDFRILFSKAGKRE